MATDLNLHRRSTSVSPDTPEGRARDREVRNRERTWIISFCLDRSFSAQMGKPYSIKEECVPRSASFRRCPGADWSVLFSLLFADRGCRPRPRRCLCGIIAMDSYMIRNALQWARSPGSIPADSALAGYAVSPWSIVDPQG